MTKSCTTNAVKIDIHVSDVFVWGQNFPVDSQIAVDSCMQDCVAIIKSMLYSNVIRGPESPPQHGVISIVLRGVHASPRDSNDNKYK